MRRGIVSLDVRDRCSVPGRPAPRAEDPGPRRRGAARRRAPRRAGVLAAAFAACLSLSARGEESVGAETAEDARILVENSIAVARSALAKEGRFDPFGFFVAPDGRVQRVTPRRDVALPGPAESLALLEAAFRQRAQAGECRAMALVADVVIALPGGGQSDALQVAIEHRSGYCQDLFHPYERSSDGTIRFGEPISSRRKGKVFPECGP
jgi:hypothetical protein